ncbi:MAG: hypothetical protein E7012_01985 [Alphaproteobacteria bacterium]|nr:hypothetical protein [Alphaproteobacteria bacterium]
MQKTSLKAFVYSFSVSLFAIFAANGVYSHSVKKPYETKIPSKNITLFLKSTTNGNANSAVPVKKIALNILPDIQPIVDDISIDNTKIIMADADIPLDASIPEIFKTEPDIKISVPLSINNTNLEKPKVIAKKAKLEIRPPALETKTVEKITIPLEVPKSAIIAKAKTIKIAENTAKVDTSEKITTSKDVPVPLLPIEKGKSNYFDDNVNVRIGETSELHHIALTDTKASINSMNVSEKDLSKKNQKAEKPQWETMSEKYPNTQSAWLVAKAEGAVKNQKLAETDAFNNKIDINTAPPKGVQLAANTVQNLLIPIPEDILNEEDLIPDLSIDPDKDVKEIKVVNEVEKNEKASNNDNNNKNKLLSSLSSMFNKETKDVAKNKNKKPDILKSIKAKLSKPSSIGKIMPTEMRLSFQPNRAEISGQTLRWVQAFAKNIANNNSSILEIRIDGTSATALQQKRLNLLYNILNNKGVEAHKINTVFTQREPNSFVIRIINLKDNKNESLKNKLAATRYQQW